MSNYKRIEEMLKNYNMYKAAVTNIKKRIALIDTDDGVSGISYEEPGTSETYKISDATGDAAINRIEKKKKLEQQLKKETLRLEMLDRCIEGLDSKKKAIVKEYYIDNKEWWQVAAVMDLTVQHCMRIRRAAIKQIVIGYFGES